MRRRTLFRSALAAVFSFLTRRTIPSPVEENLAVEHEALLREVASVVLPSSLGRFRTDEIAEAFLKWVREYKPGAEMGSGYGTTRLQAKPPNPSKFYRTQLHLLESVAARQGASFAKLDPAAKRTIVEAALRDGGAIELPAQPNGKHVAADLMSYFYSSSDGLDFLYNAAIQRDGCRGLPSSADHPTPLTEHGRLGG